MSAMPLFDRMFESTELARSVDVGRVLRDRGIEDAYDKAVRVKGEYVEKCLSAIRSFPRGARITSEDIRAKAGDVPSEINHSVLAGIMRQAASKQYGLLMITSETRTAKRASLHSKRLSVWVKL